jgi:hypothetical protein
MRRKYLVSILSLVVSLLLIGIFGCGVTISVIQKRTPNNSYLKKRVLVLPPIDRAELQSEWRAQIAANILELLGKSPHLLPYAPPKDLPLPSGATPSEFGVVNHPDLVKLAEDMNMNVLITGVLNPIEIVEKTKTWPFRREFRTYEISMFMNVVDVTNGCLCLNKLVSKNVAFRLEKAKNANKTEIIDQALQKAIPHILKEQSSAITEKLKEAPWTGRILAVNDGAIKINAGKDVGVRPDQVFTVFAQGEPITCLSGKSFDLLGKKAGEIKATSIMEDHALAVAVSGGPFSAGQIIKLRP